MRASREAYPATPLTTRWQGRHMDEIDWLRATCEHLQQQAEIHAQEARTANATIREIYQLCTGATGEPGTWHGAEPVRQLLAQLAEYRERNAELEREIAERDASFELRWNAQLRAIKAWREAGGEALTWPGHDDLCLWLLRRLEEAERLLWEVDAVARYRGDEYGVPDRIGHEGEPYQSRQLLELLDQVDRRRSGAVAAHRLSRSGDGGSAENEAPGTAATHDREDYRAAYEQERDIRTDMEALLRSLADALGVADEPHQTWEERMLEAARRERVPEAVRRLPEELRMQARAMDDGEFISDYKQGAADQAEVVARAIERALADSGQNAPGGWQSIRTAPRDGTKVLGAWHQTSPNSLLSGWAVQPVMLLGSQWVVTWNHAPVLPSHWMPRPEPPETGGRDDD